MRAGSCLTSAKVPCHLSRPWPGGGWPVSPVPRRDGNGKDAASTESSACSVVWTRRACTVTRAHCQLVPASVRVASRQSGVTETLLRSGVASVALAVNEACASFSNFGLSCTTHCCVVLPSCSSYRRASLNDSSLREAGRRWVSSNNESRQGRTLAHSLLPPTYSYTHSSTLPSPCAHLCSVGTKDAATPPHPTTVLDEASR